MKLSTQFDKNLFLVAAIWNVVAGQLALVEFKTHLQFLFNYVPPDPPISPDADFIFTLYHVILWGYVTILGVGFYLVSTDPERNSGVVTVGALSKIFMVCIWIYTYYIGNGTTLLLIGTIGDLIFALLFFHFLYRHKDDVTTTPQ